MLGETPPNLRNWWMLFYNHWRILKVPCWFLVKYYNSYTFDQLQKVKNSPDRTYSQTPTAIVTKKVIFTWRSYVLPSSDDDQAVRQEWQSPTGLKTHEDWDVWNSSSSSGQPRHLPTQTQPCWGHNWYCGDWLGFGKTGFSVYFCNKCWFYGPRRAQIKKFYFWNPH